MKRKSSAAALRLSGPRWDAVTVALFSVVLFFAMQIWTEGASVWLSFLALAVCIGRTPWRLAGERFCVPVIGFLVFMLVYGASSVYSPFGGTAAREIPWMLTAFALAAPVLFRFERRHVRGLLWGLAAVSGAVSLLSADMACEGLLYRGFVSLMELFGNGAMFATMENTAGRVNGLYNDANVTGSLFALGTIVSLYLAETGEKWKERLAACVLVSTSALGLLLSVSRGAILCFGLSLLVWLLAAGKGRRLRLFLLMVFGAGVSFAAFVPSSASVSPGSVLPQLLSVASGGVIFLLDWALGQRGAEFLGGHLKVLRLALLAGVAAVVCYGVAASQMTGPYTFRDEQIFLRSVTLDGGTYGLSGDWDGGAETTVRIYTRTAEEALQGRSTLLYSGPAEGASFTVAQRDRVYFHFRGAAGGQMRQAVLSDGTELPLAYKLLPSSLASRLHEGFINTYSYQARLEFMKDALKIFASSPLIGRGLGSTDNLYPAVQRFYYTSRYVHSHILQILADQGLLGTVPFLLFLGGGLWLLLRRLREERDPLAAALLCLWVMVNSHSLLEINFSLQPYQCFAFVVLLLPVVLYARPLGRGKLKMGAAAVCASFWVFLAVFGGLMGLRMRVRSEYENLRAGSVEQLMNALGSYARRDVFDPDPYRLEYVSTALQYEAEGYDGEVLRYVERIRKSGNYPANSALLEYYYLPVGDFRELFACSRECLLQRVSYADVWNGQAEFYRDQVYPAMGEEDRELFTEGVRAYQALLEEVNRDRLGQIVLTEENRAFVDAVIAGTWEP